MKKVTQQVEKTTQEQQETRIDTQVYKITHGAFESKAEAITAAGEARKKGFIVSLIIEYNKYKLLYDKDINKETAAGVVKRIEATGLKAEISESEVTTSN